MKRGQTQPLVVFFLVAFYQELRGFNDNRSCIYNEDLCEKGEINTKFNPVWKLFLDN